MRILKLLHARLRLQFSFTSRIAIRFLRIALRRCFSFDAGSFSFGACSFGFRGRS